MVKVKGTFVPIPAIYSERSHEKGNFGSGILFIDWLKKTGQGAWQMLPLYETQLEAGSRVKHVPSPYKGYGVGLNPKLAAGSFTDRIPDDKEKRIFLNANSEWISDYALFCALRDYFQTDDWRTWDPEIRNRETEAITNWKIKLAPEIDKEIILQWQAHQSYALLKKRAVESGIQLIGDLPFYVPAQSPLVWANQSVFDFQEKGRLRFVSGIPDSPSAHFGRQIWGHPLYNWKNKAEVLNFWKLRLRYLSILYDKIRIDHAKAFFNYGKMDLENDRNDRFEKGPGNTVFEELAGFAREEGLSIFAEDSGEGVGELRQSLSKLDICGIKILRFAFDDKKGGVNKNYADIYHYPTNTVVYTTTHDTETLLSYLNKLTPAQKQLLAGATGTDYDKSDPTFARALRAAVLNSPAESVIIPIQDWLLTTDRINVPGTELPVGDPNWSFKLNVPVEDLPVRF